ncbi:MAG: 4Fe-4S binding protein [Ruminobacter sp.]|jgi:NAD-dependent dihydropyrimidine dehydrogenase PreA subunit|nr:4Fe-4S binding protein [Ruminobacter sp.]MBR1924875.1 4Fe-4S binding protein [Ruminobacter sp.]
MFKIDHEKCTGCGSCSEVCPCGAIHPDEQNEDVFTIDFELCAECGACEAECPFEAIEEVEDAN